LVHVPASAAGPEGVVAQAVINAINTLAKRRRRRDDIFIGRSCPVPTRRVKPGTTGKVTRNDCKELRASSRKTRWTKIRRQFL
jgi:hypothetical protein